MILYLGNKLAESGRNPTSVDVLGARLGEIYPDLCALSSKRNFASRILDMWKGIWLNRRGTSVVLIDTYSTLAFHFAWSSGFLCHKLGIRYIPIIHGGEFEKRLIRSPRLAENYLQQAWVCVTPSAFLQEIVLRNSGVSPQIIPNAIDLKSYPFITPKPVPSTPKIFWLRAFQAIYNPGLAVEILNILHQKYDIKAELTMVGPDKDDSRSHVELKMRHYGLAQYVHLHARLDREEWVELAQSSTVFLNTTTVDNSPVSVIEAMALGLPVVSSRVGGIPFLVEHESDGLLFPSGNAEKAAEYLAKVLSNEPIRNLYSKNARKKAETMDWETVVRYQWRSLLD